MPYTSTSDILPGPKDVDEESFEHTDGLFKGVRVIRGEEGKRGKGREGEGKKEKVWTVATT